MKKFLFVVNYNKGSDQPVHLHNLINIFAIHLSVNSEILREFYFRE